MISKSTCVVGLRRKSILAKRKQFGMDIFFIFLFESGPKSNNFTWLDNENMDY